MSSFGPYSFNYSGILVYNQWQKQNFTSTHDHVSHFLTDFTGCHRVTNNDTLENKLKNLTQQIDLYT